MKNKVIKFVHQEIVKEMAQKKFQGLSQEESAKLCANAWQNWNNWVNYANWSNWNNWRNGP